MIDLISTKNHEITIHTLELIRLLVIQRENKVHFLANENFVPTFLKLLESDAFSDVILLSTCILWIFVYDFEKAKVECKKYHLDSKISQLEKRLYFRKGEEMADKSRLNSNAILQLVL